MDPDAYLTILSDRADALVDAAAGAMDLPVPTCPEWTVADLVVHIGRVWRWAAEIVTTGERVPREESPEDRADQALRDWAKGGATQLLDALRAADPDAQCWTFGPPPTARFWFRRQALEAVLHVWDLRAAVGSPSPIDPDVAADGLDEHLSLMVPLVLGRRPETWTGETVHFHRTDGDGDGEWFVRLGPEGKAETERVHAKADLALRGRAEALWLWCTNRATADELGIERFGDAELARRWGAEIVF